MRRTLALFVMLAAVASILAAPAAHARTRTHYVHVWGNFFYPKVTHVTPGDVVIWIVEADGHSVTADDSRFNYYPSPYRLLKPGDRVQFAFPVKETVRFYCRVHGQAGGDKPTSAYNMTGRIVVGETAPGPNPGPPEIRTVPDDYPTIAAALHNVPQASTIRLRPGVYAGDAPGDQLPNTQATAVIDVPGVTLTGMGASPGDVVLDGGDDRADGIVVAAFGVTISNLSVRGHTDTGILASSASSLTLSSVDVSNNGPVGIDLAEVLGVSLTNVSVSGAWLAGIEIRQCRPCDVDIDSSAVTGSYFGVLADNADSIAIHDSTLWRNATGIAVRSIATDDSTISSHINIEHNTISDNNRLMKRPSVLDYSVRSGVWLAGVVNATVANNQIFGHDYGILIASAGIPSSAVRVEHNALGLSDKADFGYDGIGTDVCFTDEPECDGGVSVTVPNADVIAAMAAYAIAGL